MPKRRIAMVLPGLGRVQRGAETAFLELGKALNRHPEVEIELFGSGSEAPEGVTLHTIDCIPREKFERWPKLPGLRNENQYEELTFILSLMRSGDYQPDRFDAVISCSYPHVNWFLQRAGGRNRPKLIFVTQNGDWMCFANSHEYKWFRCDGLVCINPSYYANHRERYRSVLIPNGVDPAIYRPRDPVSDQADPRIPRSGRVVLMVSALIKSKGVAEGIRAVSKVPGAFLVVAGDGPERESVSSLAKDLLPGRHLLLGSIPRVQVPQLYRQADAFLHMSRDEPFGIVYLEAAASGLPIVAPDVDVPRWILGEHGFFADTSDLKSVANAIAMALDPKVGSVRGDEARKRILDGWTWDIQASRYLDFIEQIITGTDV